MRRYVLILLSLMFVQLLSAQQLSYKHYLKIIKQPFVNDTVKAQAYVDLARILIKNNPDSAVVVLQSAEKFIKHAIHKHVRVKVVRKLRLQLATVYFLMGQINLQKSNYGLAFRFLREALQLYVQIGDTTQIADIESQIGKVYEDIGDFQKAAKFYSKSIRSMPKNSENYAKTLLNLADLYSNLGRYSKAKELYAKSYKIFQPTDSQLSANILKNLAFISQKQRDTDLAINYLRKSLKINSLLHNQDQIFDLLIWLGQIYLQKNQIDSAYKYFVAAQDMSQQLNPRQQARLQYFLARVYMKKDLNKAEKIAVKAFKVAKTQHDTALIIKLSDLLKEINLSQGNCPLALKYQNLKSKIQNEYLLKLEKQRINDTLKYLQLSLQTRVDSLEYQLKLQRTQYSSQQARFTQTIFLGLFVFTVLLIFIVTLIIRYKSAVARLGEQEEMNDLLQKLTLSEQVSADNKRKLNKLSFALDRDVSNALALMNLILPKDEIIEKFVKEYFKIFIPRNKLSGDFYWWANLNNQLYVAVADTTGLGVSGAVICAMGIRMLNKAVLAEKISDPAQILHYVSQQVDDYLNSRNIHEHFELISISLIKFDIKTRTLEFSGAKLPVYFIPKVKPKIPEGYENKLKLHHHEKVTLYELHPEKKPIGLLAKHVEFKTVKLKIDSQFTVYLFTDGYYNQFGGEFDEKFGRKKFRKLIMDISHLPLTQQREKLLDTFYQWKGEHEQTDDVTIIALKF